MISIVPAIIFFLAAFDERRENLGQSDEATVGLEGAVRKCCAYGLNYGLERWVPLNEVDENVCIQVNALT